MRNATAPTCRAAPARTRARGGEKPRPAQRCREPRRALPDECQFAELTYPCTPRPKVKSPNEIPILVADSSCVWGARKHREDAPAVDVPEGDRRCLTTF